MRTDFVSGGGIKVLGLGLAVAASVAVLVFAELDGDPLKVRMSAVAVLMAGLWLTEAVPLAATALLPLVLFPLSGISSSGQVAGEYMNTTVFLLVGGFIIALAMERWSLHRRIALNVLSLFGNHPLRIMLGFVVATAFLSMWISNTATTLVMLPIATALMSRLEHSLSADQNRMLAVGLLLSIAYAASIGGMMTLVGTAPNLVFARLYEVAERGAGSIGFAQWLLIGVPVGVAMLSVVVAYIGAVYLRRLPASEGVGEVVAREKAMLGPMAYEEKVVLAAFVATALLWITRKSVDVGALHLTGWGDLLPVGRLVDDATVVLTVAALLFFIPTRNREGGRARILDEDVFRDLPWSVVLLFGGGFALASGFVESGLSAYLASRLQGLESVGRLQLVAAVSAGMTFLTELTSNTATTQLVLPILRSAAEAMGMSPLWLMLPATFSASCAFMFPVATPPNAIIFGSGRLRVMDMVKAGFFLNLAGIVVITLLLNWAVPAVFGISR